MMRGRTIGAGCRCSLTCATSMSPPPTRSSSIIRRDLRRPLKESGLIQDAFFILLDRLSVGGALRRDLESPGAVEMLLRDRVCIGRPLIDFRRDLAVAPAGADWRVAQCGCRLRQGLAVAAAGRRRLPVSQRLYVEAGFELRGEVLMALDHCLDIVAIELSSLLGRQLVNGLSVPRVELRGPLEALSRHDALQAVPGRAMVV